MPSSDVDTSTADGDCGDEDTNKVNYNRVKIQVFLLMARLKEMMLAMDAMVVMNRWMIPKGIII